MQLSGSELAAFRARLAELKRVTPGAALTSLAVSASTRRASAREIDLLGHTG